MTAREIRAYDAFDLPDWTGTEPVTWRAETPLEAAAHVQGAIAASADHVQTLDLLAVDAAYPRPATPESFRLDAHQAWALGEVLLLQIDDRVTIAAPGTRFDANGACELLRRFARSVGAPSGNVTVSIVV